LYAGGRLGGRLGGPWSPRVFDVGKTADDWKSLSHCSLAQRHTTRRWEKRGRGGDSFMITSFFELWLYLVKNIRPSLNAWLLYVAIAVERRFWVHRDKAIDTFYLIRDQTTA